MDYSEHSVPLRVHMYSWALGGFGVALLVVLSVIDFQVIVSEWIQVALLSALYCAGALYQVAVGKAALNVAYMVLFAGLVNLGPLPAMWVLFPADLLNFFTGRRCIRRTVFNVGQKCISIIFAYRIYSLLGGDVGSFSLAGDWFALALASLTFDLFNVVFVAMSFSLRDDTLFLGEFSTIYWRQRGTFIYLYHSLALVTSVLYHHEGIPAVVLLGLVLVSTRYAFELPGQLQHHREAALRDGMTDVYNQRFLGEWKNKVGPAMIAAERPFALLFMDIDRLKIINDSWGHTSGDMIIQHVAASLKRVCRKADDIVRYGGDEFLVILPDTDPRGAMRVSERLISALRDSDVDIPFSVSMGIGAFPQDGSNLQDMFERVDRAAYRGKRIDSHTVFGAGGERVAP